jgi:hypothetical protein
MVSENKVRPTDHQIANNLFIIPRLFRDKFCLDLDWEDFEMDAFGIRSSHRSLDVYRRIGAPLRGILKPGGILVLSVIDGVLHVELQAEAA